MDNYKQFVRDAEPGRIIPIVREVDMDCPVQFFARLSDYGRKKDCCLFESRERLSGSQEGELTFGTANPALYLTGRGAEFAIRALTATGRRMIRYLASDAGRFAFCSSVDVSEDAITGTLNRAERTIDEASRLKSTNQMDVIRAVAFAFELASKPFRVTCGLLGAISYDFVDQFEDLPANESDILGNPDYELYFADNIFLMDHATRRGYVVVNVMVTDDDRDEIAADARQCFDYYFNMSNMADPRPRKFGGELSGPESDTTQAEYEEMVQAAKRHIIDGDIFQVVLSRTLSQTCPQEPLDVYRRLRVLNPSPYMFYLNTQNTILTGASPELNLRVGGTDKRVVEIRPIAGTKPRGRALSRMRI